MYDKGLSQTANALFLLAESYLRYPYEEKRGENPHNVTRFDLVTNYTTLGSSTPDLEARLPS